MEVIFWIERCDPSVAENIFLFDKDENIQLNICKYGNVHLTEFHKENLNEVRLIQLVWAVIEGEEFDYFSDDGIIKGRKIKI